MRDRRSNLDVVMRVLRFLLGWGHAGDPYTLPWLKSGDNHLDDPKPSAQSTGMHPSDHDRGR
jgi:hypothetical protein